MSEKKLLFCKLLMRGVGDETGETPRDNYIVIFSLLKAENPASELYGDFSVSCSLSTPKSAI